MALPSLSDLEGAMDRACADRLGETIQYAAGGAVFAPVKAHVDYSEIERVFEGAQVIEQNMLVALLIADVPVEPTSAARVTLPKLAGKTYRPVNVRRDESGTHWRFELKDTAGG